MMKKSRPEYSQLVALERSKSRTGKHAFVSLAFIVDRKSGEVKESIKPKGHHPSVYVKGEGELREVEYDDNDVLVVVQMVKSPQRNPKKSVKGKILVFDKGQLVYRAVYRDLKLRGSFGEPHYIRYVRSVMSLLQVPIKRENPDAHLPKRGHRHRH
ncbi:hypothetical protein IPA_04170 [Ignicoccus pacificus DSM 13166]|uniref:Uncharacterized protein n=1 Tax=Ignicoccus pacificus DSM 13166 TaxID=940294 RepID=A0A977K9F4_9CREN|nr:hypothetical protein IPA_04170 [Ignicoccus pacificus DSM 13166]